MQFCQLLEEEFQLSLSCCATAAAVMWFVGQSTRGQYQQFKNLPVPLQTCHSCLAIKVNGVFCFKLKVRFSEFLSSLKAEFKVRNSEGQPSMCNPSINTRRAVDQLHHML